MIHQIINTTKLTLKTFYVAVQKKGYVDLQEIAWEDNVLNCYGATLPKDPSHNMPCSWAPGDPSSFLIRGSNYLEDHQKVIYFYSYFVLVIIVSRVFVSSATSLFFWLTIFYFI